jgi:succinate-acetate transporter protein
MSRVSTEKPQHKGIIDAFRVDVLLYLLFWEHFTLKMLFSTLALESWYLSTLTLELTTVPLDVSAGTIKDQGLQVLTQFS